MKVVLAPKGRKKYGKQEIGTSIYEQNTVRLRLDTGSDLIISKETWKKNW